MKNLTKSWKKLDWAFAILYLLQPSVWLAFVILVATGHVSFVDGGWTTRFLVLLYFVIVLLTFACAMRMERRKYRRRNAQRKGGES